MSQPKQRIYKRVPLFINTIIIIGKMRKRMNRNFYMKIRLLIKRNVAYDEI